PMDATSAMMASSVTGVPERWNSSVWRLIGGVGTPGWMLKDFFGRQPPVVQLADSRRHGAQRRGDRLHRRRTRRGRRHLRQVEGARHGDRAAADEARL